MNYRLIVDFVDRYYVPFAIAVFLIFAWFILASSMEANKRNNKCIELGGIMVKTPSGFSCAKLTKIEIN